MDRFFPVVSQLLSKQGLFYLVTVSDNNPGRRKSRVIMSLTTATITYVAKTQQLVLNY